MNLCLMLKTWKNAAHKAVTVFSISSLSLYSLLVPSFAFVSAEEPASQEIANEFSVELISENSSGDQMVPLENLLSSLNLGVCGDGNVDISEQCDGNSLPCFTDNMYDGTKLCSADCTFGACVTTQFCGDGEKNGNEQCDYNYPFEQPFGMVCTQACQFEQAPYCGDSIVNQATEECDGQIGVADGMRCTKSCKLMNLADCGNGVLDIYEECDGTIGIIGLQTCSIYCEIMGFSLCGNGIKNFGEQCDGQDGVTPGFSCSQDCKLIPLCGNGVLDPGEECDGTAGVIAGKTCSNECKLVAITPYCGNGVKEAGEECDGSDGTPSGYTCSSDCKLSAPSASSGGYPGAVILPQFLTSGVGGEAPQDLAPPTPEPQVLGETLEPKLELKKTSSKIHAKQNDTIKFTIELKNTGDVPAQSVKLTDQLPSGLSYKTGAPKTRTWEMDELAPGESKTFTVDVIVNSDASPGTVKNNAKAEAANHSPVTASVSIEIVKPQVLGVKLPETGMDFSELAVMLMTLFALAGTSIYLRKQRI